MKRGTISLLLLGIAIVGSSNGMQVDLLVVEKITDQEGLKRGLELASKMYDTVYSNLKNHVLWAWS